MSVWDPRWRALTAGLVLTITLVAFEALAVITILPRISDDLGGIGLYGWVSSAFSLGTLVGIVVAGDLADRRGPAAPFLVGTVLFAAGLLAAGAAPTMAVLVVARGLQGLGAGAIPAVAYVSIGRTYPHELRPRIFAILSTAWVVPGLAGPGLSAGVAHAAGWRVVFLGLLPLVAVSSALALGALRRIPPPEPDEARGPSRLLDALRIAAGAGLVLGGLTGRSPVLGPLVVLAGILVAARALRRVLPEGTLVARPGLPSAVLSRGLLTFAFFGADIYVPLLITDVRGSTTAMAGVAVTAATLCWTAGAWTQERLARRWEARRLVSVGMVVLAAGIAATSLGLSTSVPVGVAIAGWGVGGLGIGLAYAPISMLVLREAPAGREGAAASAMQIADVLGVALGAGLGGVFVAAAGSAGGDVTWGIAAAFALTAAVAVAGRVVAGRLPPHVVGAAAGPAPAAQPAVGAAQDTAAMNRSSSPGMSGPAG